MDALDDAADDDAGQHEYRAWNQIGWMTVERERRRDPGRHEEQTQNDPENNHVNRFLQVE